MKRIWISLIGAGLLVIAAVAPAAGQSIFSVPLDDVDDSGISGGASIRSVDGQTEITVFISQGESGGVHPVHVHQGTCEELGDIVHPLENVTEGESVTTLDVELADLMTGEYAINAHQSEDDLGTSIMCGNIPAVEGLGADEGDEASDDEEATEDEGDDTAQEDEETTDEGDDAAEEDMDDEESNGDDAAEDDEEDVADLAPDAGTIDGASGNLAFVLMMVMAGGTAGAGLLMRSRVARA